MGAWPKRVVKYGEPFDFKEEKPGWLVYENEEHIILVGREEAFALEVKEEGSCQK